MNIWDIYKSLKTELSEDDTVINNVINNLENISINSNKESDSPSDKCQNCNECCIILSGGVNVCTSCGVESNSMVMEDQEWRYYSNDNKRSSDPTRCGMPVNPLLPNSSLGTIILGYGNEVFRKLQRWNSMSYKERSLLNVFNNINDKAIYGDIAICASDKAKVFYKELSENKINRGGSRDGLIAACLYYSCKDKNDSRSTREISALFNIKVKKITKGCKQFRDTMHYKCNNYSKKIKPTTPANFIKRFCAKLSLSDINQDKSIYIASMAEKLGIVSENTPPSIAVGSIYMLSIVLKLGISKKYISEKCDISEVTISKTYKKMLPFEKFLINSTKI